MNKYVSLAKKALETYVKEGEIIQMPKKLPKEMLEERAGVFVTIEKNGQLRGCVGTSLPTQENIAQEIIHCAISVATQDHRFGPVLEHELSELSYSVCVLSTPELIGDIDELNPQKYGIIVTNVSGQTGLLLPNLEGVDTVEQQIAIACQKAGIDATSEKIALYRFTVKKYE